MKRLLALTAVCLPFYLLAQGFGSFSHDQPFFASSGTSTPVWTPTNLVNIAGWYIADEFYTNASPSYPVLPDKSGNGYNLTNRAAASLWPLWMTNALGGHYTVKWDGANDHLVSEAFDTATNTELHMVLKYNSTVHTTSYYIYAGYNYGANPNVNISTAAGNQGLVARSSTTANLLTYPQFSTNKWIVLSVFHTGSGEIRTNNVLASNATSMDNGQTGLVFGTRNDLAFGWTPIEVAEIIICGTSQTEGARSNLFNHWTNKYSISP